VGGTQIISTNTIYFREQFVYLFVIQGGVSPLPAMKPVTVSPRFHVVIPRKVREALQLKPGEKVEVVALDDRIELIPVRPIRSMRGFLKGLDTNIEREEDRLL